MRSLRSLIIAVCLAMFLSLVFIGIAAPELIDYVPTPGGRLCPGDPGPGGGSGGGGGG
jgi:hypothetical protein